MSTISGACSESLASQLFKQHIEENIQQRQLDKAELEEKQTAINIETNAFSQERPPNNSQQPKFNEGLKGGLIDTYA